MVAEIGGHNLDDEAKRVLQRLAKFALEAGQPGRLVPYEYLEDDLEPRLEETASFILRKLEQRGVAQVVELEWNGTEKQDLQTEFLSLVRGIIHVPFFYEQKMESDRIEINVVSGITDDPMDPDTHLMQFRISGQGVDNVIKNYQKWKASFRWEE